MPLFRRIPKRGFSHATWDKNYHVVNVGDLDDASTTAPPSTPDALQEGRPGQGPGRRRPHPRHGEVTKKLTVKAHHFSKSAAGEDHGQGRHGRGHPAAQEAGAQQDEAAQAEAKRDEPA